MPGILIGAGFAIAKVNIFRTIKYCTKNTIYSIIYTSLSYGIGEIQICINKLWIYLTEGRDKVIDQVLKDIDKEIEDIFYAMVKVRSDTNTVYEKNMEAFFMNYFKNVDYFKKNPDHYGMYKINNDPFGRHVSWALVKGEGKDTVILINHSDVVDIEDFKTLKDYAYSPKELERKLFSIKEELSDEARNDLESGEYIFGRGTADMKAGAAIQLVLLRSYSEFDGLKGNLLYLSVPDEENMSAGMRSAIGLLEELNEKFGLNYIVTINSEPHQRIVGDTGIISEGSVGKMMPFVYVRGSLSHVGKVFEGFNPISLLSMIVNKTELNLSLSDFINCEASPPPTWLNFRDSKTHYDVSMPLNASGYMSVLTLNKNPNIILEEIKKLCIEAFLELIKKMNQKYKIFCENTNRAYEPLPWKPKVVTFQELYDEAFSNYSSTFTDEYYKKLEEAKTKVISGEKSIVDINFELVEGVFDFIDDLSPRVVIGLAPPYYPNVSNINIHDCDDRFVHLSDKIIQYVKKNFDQTYVREYFFTGISDLSYTYMQNSETVAQSLRGNMPLYETLYSIPLDKIERFSMPCFNIGPWGKDFHKLTERVLIEDLFIKTPRILNYVISLLIT